MPIRLLEIKYAVSNGAKEIDIVLSRAHVLQGNWEQVYNEVKEARQACGDAHLKTILATGEVIFQVMFLQHAIGYYDSKCKSSELTTAFTL